MKDNANGDEHNDNDHNYIFDDNAQVDNCGSFHLKTRVSSALDRHLYNPVVPTIMLPGFLAKMNNDN